jgi:hypothetical protein
VKGGNRAREAGIGIGDHEHMSITIWLASRATRSAATRPLPASRARFPIAAALCAVAILLACTPSAPKTDIRQWVGGMAFRISTNPVPPRARESIDFKVVVLDQESRQPIESGEGRVYAMNEDSVKVWDSLVYGPEPGTYHAKLSFVTSGNWAIGLQFRRDSTRKLETMNWTQEVRAER